MRTSIAGGEVETLVAGLDFPDDLLILEPWVYWADPVAGVVGRVGLDGSARKRDCVLRGAEREQFNSLAIVESATGGGNPLPFKADP